MITRDEAITLYEMAILGDNRSEPSRGQLLLWMEISKAGGWTFEQGMRAIIEHRNERPGVYFEPGHITQRVAEVRRQIAQRWYCPDPPRDLADDPRAEIAWKRQAAEEFKQRNLARWAAGEPLEDPSTEEPPTPKRAELPTGGSAAARAALTAVRRFERSTVIPGDSGVPSPRVGAERRGEARAELDAVRRESA